MIVQADARRIPLPDNYKRGQGQVASRRDDADGLCVGKNNGKRNLRNVWTFPTQPYKGAHFATFPGELPRRCLKAASKPGDLVLDPFAGSGTVGKVALELGRKPILLDIAYTPGDYLSLAKQRMAEGESVP